MRVLAVGGTVFLSAAVAQDFLDRGHDVACPSRSPSARAPQGVREVGADCGTGPAAHDDVHGDGDGVVDVATDPRFVREALEALGERARRWT